ncbi:hypothetical protein SK128_021165 [Halocaridina rubra]|uniref:MPN domain-containing protein n=1 Tax=Halocaridina rubra TaxID=373956 RepID=A0AAN8X7Q4_HALRR
MSVETPTPVPEEIQIDDEVEEIEEDEEEEEAEEDEDEMEEEEEEEEIEAVTHGRSTGRGLTLKTLLKEGVLQPGEGSMTINYLGNKFKGDLLPDGRIKSQETNKIFGTPSAWAIYCKKIVNPDKKSGCGWASVRYRGKKLDSYKNNWYRQKRLEFEKEGEALDEEEMTDSDSEGPHEQEIVEFELIGNRHPNHDMNTMVELTSFQSLGRMQPFTVTMSSSAMAVIDVHAHLSTSEVVGYLAGQWDVTNHNLIVSHALPVRCRLGDGEKGSGIEKMLYDEMDKLNLSLVGWYHTHPFSPPLPTLRDIDSQLEYEMKMKGSNDASYTPCIGIIVSPYVRGGGQGATTSGFWVMPPPEHKPQEYGRPMSIQFTIVQDAFIPKDALLHMCKTVKYYKDSPDSVIFSDIFQDRHTYWDKLKTAIRMCVPKDHFSPLVDYLAKLLDLTNFVNEQNALQAKPKTPLSAGKVESPGEAEALDPIEPSSSTSAVNEGKERPEIISDVENLHSSTSPDSSYPSEVLQENQESFRDKESLPESQNMDISYSQEHAERSFQEEPPQTFPDPEPALEPDADYEQPTSYQHSPPPYQPPPYQPPQYQPPPYQSLQEDVANREQRQETLPQQDYYQDDYRAKQTEVGYQQPQEPEESNDYLEPPPDYHQQHFSISSSSYEAPQCTESYEQEEPKHTSQSSEVSGNENLHPDEDVNNHIDAQESHQYSDSISSIAHDPWSQRLDDSMQQPHHLHQQQNHHQQLQHFPQQSQAQPQHPTQPQLHVRPASQLLQPPQQVQPPSQPQSLQQHLQSLHPNRADSLSDQEDIQSMDVDLTSSLS